MGLLAVHLEGLLDLLLEAELLRRHRGLDYLLVHPVELRLGQDRGPEAFGELQQSHASLHPSRPFPYLLPPLLPLYHQMVGHQGIRHRKVPHRMVDLRPHRSEDRLGKVDQTPHRRQKVEMVLQLQSKLPNDPQLAEDRSQRFPAWKDRLGQDALSSLLLLERDSLMKLEGQELGNFLLCEPYRVLLSRIGGFDSA